MTEHLPASLRAYSYKPRRVAFQGARAIGRWHVKGTVVTVRGSAAHFSDIVEGGWAEAERLLATVPDNGRDAGVAHALIHLGLAGVALRLDWWSEGDMLLHRQVHASFDDPTRFSDVDQRHRGLSLWDLAVQAHERDAWLRHVLANPAGPDLVGYLADGLDGVL